MCDVVIAGAGPNGLLLACELRLAGAEPVVLERLPQPSQEVRANGLVGQVVRMLDRRGLATPLTGSAQPPQPIPTFAFAALPLDLHALADNPLYLVAVAQPRIEQVLAERAAELGVQVRRGHAVTGLTQHPDAVTVQVAGPDGPYPLHARYLVGADGGRSTVRKACGIGFPGASDHDAVARQAEVGLSADLHDPETGVLRVPGLDPLPPTLTQRTERGVLFSRYHRTDRGILVVGRLPDGSAQVYAVEHGAVDGETPVTLAEVRASVARILDADLPFGPPPGAGPHLLRRTLGGETRVADRYADGRVLLVGDAAHVHSPIGGPGLNLGLQDAVNLGWKLAATVNGWAPPDLLASYDAERRPVGQRVAMSSLAQLALLGPGAEITALRELVGELLDDHRTLAHVVDLMAGADIRYPMGTDATHPLIGGWAPDLAVHTGAGAVRLAELTRSARPLLLDLTGHGSLAGVADPWRDRVDTVTGCSPDTAATALLLRPDCYIAWATDVSRPGEGERRSLRSALATWFGAPRFSA